MDALPRGRRGDHALYLFVKPFAGSGPVINVLGLAPVVAIAVGVRLHRPEARLAWAWVAIGFVLFWLGDVYTYTLPDRAPPRGAVPVAWRRRVSGGLPGPHRRGPHSPAAPQPAHRSRQRDRRRDPDGWARAAVVGLADRAVRPRPLALDGRPARLRGVSAGRRAAARRRREARPGRRAAAPVLPPDERQHHLPAGHRLRLRPDAAPGDLRPPALARRGLDRLLPALGRRRAPPHDVGARSARGAIRRGAHSLPSRPARAAPP